MLTAERLREVLSYDPATGVFRWLVVLGRRSHVGAVAGSKDAHGYTQIGIDGRGYRACRIAFLYMTGTWPPDQIDHINGAKGDDRWANLRDASAQTNQQNRRSAQSDNINGLLGVSRSSSKTRFVARIRVSDGLKHLGTYDTAHDAHAAYVEAKRRLHAGCTI